ncbi:UrcA family protein [Novosphingobium naphthalenivorans]|uniref:UrcA family protein n=1 Tax=Novosphingobium naphthalenivorans TaxID=273168 RepID=UPI000AA49581|nr:UrcA family protein [Novosphingobium naphthalenivorans]
MKKWNAALAATGLLTLPAMALPAIALAAPAESQEQGSVKVLAAPVEGREWVSVRVSTEGLDLTKTSDVIQLRTRAKRAIDEACHPKGYLNPTGARDWKCYSEMTDSAERATSRFARNLASN